ncbi:MAG: hypothetical protein ACLFU8_10525, partial [Anaerolineales bacterium]
VQRAPVEEEIQTSPIDEEELQTARVQRAPIDEEEVQRRVSETEERAGRPETPSQVLEGPQQVRRKTAEERIRQQPGETAAAPFSHPPTPPEGKPLQRAAAPSPTVPEEEESIQRTPLSRGTVKRTPESPSGQESTPDLPGIDSALVQRLTARADPPTTGTSSPTLLQQQAAPTSAESVAGMPESTAESSATPTGEGTQRSRSSPTVQRTAEEPSSAAHPALPLQRRAIEPMTTAPTMTLPPVKIQRTFTVVQRSPGESPVVVRRATADDLNLSDSAAEEPGEAPMFDVDGLAREVYPLIKRMLRTELERRTRRV